MERQNPATGKKKKGTGHPRGLFQRKGHTRLVKSKVQEKKRRSLELRKKLWRDGGRRWGVNEKEKYEALRKARGHAGKPTALEWWVDRGGMK